MNSIKIDLTEHKYLEFDEINFDKKINLVFGKNGTGKSTITEEILKQKHYKKIGEGGEVTDYLSDNQNEKYDVRVFQGFSELFGENEKMDAFSLEVNATQNQDKIKSKEAEEERIKGNIKDLEDSLVKLESGEYTTQELKDAKNNLGKKEREIDTQVYSKIVDKVKNIDKLDTQYANTDGKLKADIAKVKADDYEQLQNVEKESLSKVIKETTKDAVDIYVVDVPNLESLLTKTNDLLKKEVVISDRCIELDTPEKEAFANKGKELHDVGDACAFCGGSFTAERLKKLNQHFNKEYQALEKSVKDFLEILNDVDLPLLEQADFYAQFEVKDLNGDIKYKKTEVNTFIGKLREGLEKKLKNISSKIDKIDIAMPETKELQDKIDNLILENNKFGQNLEANKRKAEEKLRLNVVFEKLKELKYDDKSREREKLQEDRDKAKSNLNEKLKEKEELEDSLEGVLTELNALKPKAEKEAVRKINEKLAQCNFKIKLKDDSYYCLDDDRSLKTLSSGEKNLIAFLYFIEKLKELPADGESQKAKIIVFDDPMNSNDDTNQYLIIMELREIMKNIMDSDSADTFVCLTHNVHFYINLKYKFRYSEMRVQRLVGGQIKTIEKFEDDFKTSYESLWRELRFLYENEKPELMLNPIRRICETFEKFNNIDHKEFYKDNSEIEKYTNVNSHSIDDLEADLNGKGKEQIMEMLKKLFENNNYAGHYSKYWTDESE